MEKYVSMIFTISNDIVTIHLKSVNFIVYFSCVHTFRLKM